MLGGGWDEVATLVVCCSDEAPTFGIPSGMGVRISMPYTFGPGRRKPGTTMLIQWRWGSLALMTHLGAWKLDEIGVYPKINWAVRNWPSEFTNTSALRILSRLSLLTSSSSVRQHVYLQKHQRNEKLQGSAMVWKEEKRRKHNFKIAILSLKPHLAAPPSLGKRGRQSNSPTR